MRSRFLLPDIILRNCSDLWGSTGHQASHRGAAKHGICFASRLVPSNVNSYHSTRPNPFTTLFQSRTWQKAQVRLNRSQGEIYICGAGRIDLGTTGRFCCASLKHGPATARSAPGSLGVVEVRTVLGRITELPAFRGHGLPLYPNIRPTMTTID